MKNNEKPAHFRARKELQFLGVITAIAGLTACSNPSNSASVPNAQTNLTNLQSLSLTQASPVGSHPQIFFTDLTSGPNTGGENGNGAYVTIYGTGFGSTQGTSTVTVGGGEVAAVKQWGVPSLPIKKFPCNLDPRLKLEILSSLSVGRAQTLSRSPFAQAIFIAYPLQGMTANQELSAAALEA